ncbi:hypothetical protein [Oceanibaculum indicum]|uniref:Uncharacterized protein n=1 Tax=Oceanibaculum indicum TaxID=526216 RepID=A0A420WR05_9PROT|nr:hypothetical protein [Oceanibaculum indicum]RKQ73481.1 hypothetical protein BCL74_1270 [Oceanibaculum indicum]
MTRPPKDARQEMRGAVERWSAQINDPTELRRILIEATGAKLPGRPAIAREVDYRLGKEGGEK